MRVAFILFCLLTLYGIVGSIDVAVQEAETHQKIVSDFTDTDVECADDCLDTEPEYIFYSELR